MKLALLDETSAKGVLYFNVEGSVGWNSKNLFEDVLLVQFFLRTLGRPGMLTGSNNIQPRMAKVPLSGHCDNPTIDGIRAFQEYTTTVWPYCAVVDGVVSPVKGNSVSIGGVDYAICSLNRYMRDSFFEVWPLLTEIPGCPAKLMVKCSQLFHGGIIAGTLAADG
jgi:hypothetical protein